MVGKFIKQLIDRGWTPALDAPMDVYSDGCLWLQAPFYYNYKVMDKFLTVTVGWNVQKPTEGYVSFYTSDSTIDKRWGLKEASIDEIMEIINDNGWTEK